MNNTDNKFSHSIQTIPQDIQDKMNGATWHEGCPVTLDQLAYLNVSYFGFDQQTHTGELVVHQDVAREVIDIFKALYEQQFPISQMKLMHHYEGNDEASMEDNNTSAFNCRANTSRPDQFSKHSYGLAIDLNPRLNPYINGDKIQPKNAHEFIKRDQLVPGMIHRNDAVYSAFIKQGWKWGGDFTTVVDYQHFERKGVKYNFET